jgi:hypothetical protein
MFTLKIYDRKGTELKQGDLVKISDGRRITFYSEFRYIEETGTFHPFHTFSWHSVEKVDCLPEGLLPSKVKAPVPYWYFPDLDEDKEGKNFDDYYQGWKECERLLDCFYKVELIKDGVQAKLF